jgi:NitT/TauT family transport system substrate-binding protein
MIKRRTLLTAAAALPLAIPAIAPLAAPAIAQSRLKVRFAGGGIALYSYMPFFVAIGQNLFAKHGLDAEIAMFPGGAPAMQAVLGGSSDVACGYYEHTITIAAKGGHLTAFVLQAQNSGLCLGVRKDLAGEIKTAADLKGRKIGVSAPGSATHLFAMQLMVKAGLKRTDAAAIGVGTAQTALAAFEHKDIDALSLFDPIVADLERRNEIVVIADARDTKGSTAIFGGPYASGSLYAESGWLAKNEAACRGAAAAIVEAVNFLKTATPDQAIGALGKGMCFLDAGVCGDAFTRNREAFNHNGTISLDQAETVKRMLAGFDPGIASANVDLGPTFTNRLVTTA